MGGIASPLCGLSGSPMGRVSGRSSVRPLFFWYAPCGDNFCAGRGNCGTVARWAGGGVTWRTGILKAKFTDFDVDVLVEFFKINIWVKKRGQEGGLGITFNIIQKFL